MIRLFEKVFLAIFIVGISFKTLHWPNAGEFMIIGTLGLSLLYIFGLGRIIDAKHGRKSELEEGTTDSVMNPLLGVAAGIGVICLANNFIIARWAIPLTIIGFCVILLAALYIFIQRKKSSKNSSKGIKIRFAILVLGLAFFIISPFAFIDNYVEDSTNLKMTKDLMKDPLNDSLDQALTERFTSYLDSGNADGWQSRVTP